MPKGLNLEWLLTVQIPNGQIFSGKVDAGKDEKSGPYVLAGTHDFLLATLDCQTFQAKEISCVICCPANWERKSGINDSMPEDRIRLGFDRKWKSGQESKSHVRSSQSGKILGNWRASLKKI